MVFNFRTVRTAALLSMPLVLLAAVGASRIAHSAIPIARSTLPRETTELSSVDVSALVAGNTAFAVDAYRLIGKKYAGHNVFFSPYSISMTLSMVYAGARGETADAMAAAMRFSLPRERLHRAFGALDAEVSSRSSDGIVLQAANSMWAGKGSHFEKPFLDTLAQSYGAGVGIVDFVGDPDGSRKRINAWVSDSTGQTIRDLLGAGAVDESTVLLLTNAVYFRGDWRSPFERQSTTRDVFSRLDGRTADVSMMHSQIWGGSAQRTDYDAVELRYRGSKIAMDIVMPKVGTLAAFEERLTGRSLDAIVEGLKAEELELWMPKFRLPSTSTRLKDVLGALGMGMAFDSRRADLSGVASDAPVFLRDVIHSATVAVDEKGTEAAAATAIDGVGAGYPPPRQIRIDHPFFFVIRDVPTAAILFVGRVTDPSNG